MINTDSDDIYATALNEIETRQQQPMLWVKALKMAEGNAERQKVEYIRLRVQEESSANISTASITPKKDLFSLSNGLISLAFGAVLVVMGMNGFPILTFIGGPFVFVGMVITALYF